ncbi:MAG: hypothetical protein ACOYN5_07970 [Bacteroidales bacterium]
MKTAPWIIIVVLVLIILIQNECHHCPDVTKMITNTDTVKGDPYPVPYPVVEIRDHDSIIYDTTYLDQPVDTFAILTDYFAIRFGNDTIANDTSIFVSVDWKVTQNRLLKLKPYIQNRRAKVINYITPEEKKQIVVFAGGGLSFNQLRGFGMYGAASLQTKRDHLYSFMVDPFHKEVSAAALLKISFRRKL